MVSNAAERLFAYNWLFNLVATPTNVLGGAMTSFTAQNGAGQYDRISPGRAAGAGHGVHSGDLAAGTGLLLTRGDFCYHVFLSADKVTPDAVRYGNSLLYVDSPCTCFWALSLWCATACRASGAAAVWLGAGAELVARIPCVWCRRGWAVGGAVSADAPAMASTPCAADPMAWIAVIRCCACLSSQHHQERLPVFMAQPKRVTAVSFHPRHSVPGIFLF